jgi:hypothetical protein
MRANHAKSATNFANEADNGAVRAIECHERPCSEGGAIRESVSRALSLKPRGGIGKDGLVVRNLSARLRVQLLARPIHPWDRSLPSGERNELFVQQCLEDVSTAIPNLFRTMSEIDEMEVTVLDPRSKRAIISGIVKRCDALAANGLSAGMRLRAMGLDYGRTNWGFEPIEENSVIVMK